MMIFGIPVFDSALLPEGFEHRIGLATFKVSLALDDGPFVVVPDLSICDLYGPMPPRGRAVADTRLQTVFPALPEGRHKIKVRWVREHFRDGWVCQAVDTLGHASWSSVFRSPSGRMLQSMGRCVGDFPDIVVLNRRDSLEAKPMFIDTLIDTLELWLFDQYPEDFPKLERRPSRSAEYHSGLNISAINIVKLSSTWFATRIRGDMNPDSLFAPVAARFEVREPRSKRVLMKGDILLSSHDGLDLSYGPGLEATSGWAVGSSRGVIREVSRSTSGLNVAQEEFDKLRQQSPMESELVLIPDIEVARRFGSVYEFCGDTLRFVIKLSVCDSTSNP